MGLLLFAGWALMLPMMGQEPGTLDTDFQDGGMLLLAPFGATSFENAQDVIALERREHRLLRRGRDGGQL